MHVRKLQSGQWDVRGVLMLLVSVASPVMTCANTALTVELLLDARSGI